MDTLECTSPSRFVTVGFSNGADGMCWWLIGLVFRAYDEGAAFRYIVPEQDGADGFEIVRELTEWRFPGKCCGWFTSYGNHVNSNEAPFFLRGIGEIQCDELIGLPATVEVAGQWVALCEAALVNWAGFYFKTPDGIEALRALPAVWKNSTPVGGECGKFYLVVRETFDGRFYFAGITVKRRHVELLLDFLPDGEWRMETFADDPAFTPGDYTAIRLGSNCVSRGQTVSFDMVDEGGAVAIFSRAE